MDELARLIAQVGFPIVVALYVLVRLDQTLARNTQAHHEQAAATVELRHTLDNLVTEFRRDTWERSSRLSKHSED